MPIETLRINGKDYLYFSYYDTATRRKKRMYCGPKSDPKGSKRAHELERRYKRTQLEKNAAAKRFSLLADLVSEVEASGCDSSECRDVLKYLIYAYPDLEWISSEYTALLGWVNESPERLRDALESTLERVKEDAKKIGDSKNELRYLLDHAYAEWNSQVRYRSEGDVESALPEWDPALKHRAHDLHQKPQDMISEILKGLLDSNEHSQCAVRKADDLAGAHGLGPLSRALTFIGLFRILESSKKSFLRALKVVDRI